MFTNADGRYEFPALQAGSYTLRVATPAPYKAYTRDAVSIKGATPLEDIVLDLIPSVEPVILRGGLAPTPEVMSQLSGAEWLWNLPGTAEDKIDLRQSVRHRLPQLRARPPQPLRRAQLAAHHRTDEDRRAGRAGADDGSAERGGIRGQGRDRGDRQVARRRCADPTRRTRRSACGRRGRPVPRRVSSSPSTR